MAIACDKAPNAANQNSTDPSKQNTKPGSVKSYRFKSKVEKCDTYNRIFQTQIEMCYAIQVDELNNDCAAPERLAFFTENCANLVKLDAEQAKQKIINVDGNSVECTLTESGLPTIRQFTGTPTMIMEHTSIRAVVLHSAKVGKVGLRMSLIDINSNREITRIQRTWQDETEPLTLSAPTVIGSPVLTCLVSLAQDPNRE